MPSVPPRSPAPATARPRRCSVSRRRNATIAPAIGSASQTGSAQPVDMKLLSTVEGSSTEGTAANAFDIDASAAEMPMGSPVPRRANSSPRFPGSPVNCWTSGGSQITTVSTAPMATAMPRGPSHRGRRPLPCGEHREERRDHADGHDHRRGHHVALHQQRAHGCQRDQSRPRPLRGRPPEHHQQPRSDQRDVRIPRAPQHLGCGGRQHDRCAAQHQHAGQAIQPPRHPPRAQHRRQLAGHGTHQQRRGDTARDPVGQRQQVEQRRAGVAPAVA